MQVVYNPFYRLLFYILSYIQYFAICPYMVRFVIIRFKMYFNNGII